MSDKPKFKEDFFVEQGPEEILRMLENAAEQGQWVELTVLSADGSGSMTKQRVLPWSFDGEFLVLETENGEGMSIELSRIRMAQLPEAEPETPAK
ncbi:MAG: hypothetical protein NTY81_01725 [Candidatus Staskawiczbacteria bacterium]|nr:hypothetical protein [Candidatus Staskawiczbacteria bacterium]